MPGPGGNWPAPSVGWGRRPGTWRMPTASPLRSCRKKPDLRGSWRSCRNGGAGNRGVCFGCSAGHGGKVNLLERLHCRRPSQPGRISLAAIWRNSTLVMGGGGVSPTYRSARGRQALCSVGTRVLDKGAAGNCPRAGLGLGEALMGRGEGPPRCGLFLRLSSLYGGGEGAFRIRQHPIHPFPWGCPLTIRSQSWKWFSSAGSLFTGGETATFPGALIQNWGWIRIPTFARMTRGNVGMMQRTCFDVFQCFPNKYQIHDNLCFDKQLFLYC